MLLNILILYYTMKRHYVHKKYIKSLYVRITRLGKLPTFGPWNGGGFFTDPQESKLQLEMEKYLSGIILNKRALKFTKSFRKTFNPLCWKKKAFDIMLIVKSESRPLKVYRCIQISFFVKHKLYFYLSS